MNKPIVGITLLFAIGIISGRYLNLFCLPVYFVILGLVILTLLFHIRKKPRLVSLFLFTIIFLMGLFEFRYLYFPHSSLHIVSFAPTPGSVEVAGYVANRPQLKGRRVDFVLKARRIRICRKEEEVEGRVWVRSYSPFQDYDYGDMVMVKGKLRRPEASEEGFNWQRYLSYQGIWTEVNTGRVEVLKRGEGNFLVKEAYKSRDWMAGVIDSTLPRPHSSLLKGIMLGDKASLPPGVQEDFLRTGTGHILVVSGLHVGLILFIIFTFFKTLGFSPRLISLLAIPFLIYYAILTGLRAPVLRATIMASVGLFSLLIDRDIHPLVILSLAALIILVFNPLSLFTASFQLSFIAVGGIIYLVPYLGERLRRLAFRLSDSLAVSLAAQISILPLLAFYFNQLPLIGAVTNLIIAPVITVILSLGFLTLALSLVTCAGAQIMANANWVVLSILLKISGFFSFHQSRVISELACPSTGSFSPWVLFTYYSGLIMAPHLVKKMKDILKPQREG